MSSTAEAAAMLCAEPGRASEDPITITPHIPQLSSQDLGSQVGALKGGKLSNPSQEPQEPLVKLISRLLPQHGRSPGDKQSLSHGASKGV